MRTDPELEYRIQKLREERERIERRVYEDTQRLRAIGLELALLRAAEDR